MSGGKYFFIYIYQLTHSILINHPSLTACYHKGQHCYGTCHEDDISEKRAMKKMEGEEKKGATMRENGAECRSEN